MVQKKIENQTEQDSNKEQPTPWTFRRNYSQRLRLNEERRITIEFVNRPAPQADPSQPLYTHIPEQPAILHYGPYPLRTMTLGGAWSAT